MIAKIRGKIEGVKRNSVTVEVGGFCYEVMVPPALIPLLEKLRMNGDDVSLYTLHYLEGGFKGTSQIPRLIGFMEEEDKDFFELYTTVKGVGGKTALKSITVAVEEIALAIERGDIKRLNSLPGITKRLAEKIVAELKGKVASFAVGGIKEVITSVPTLQPFVEEAVGVLTGQLGFRRQEAEERIRKALEANPDIAATEDIIRAVFYQRREEVEQASPQSPK